MRVFATLPKLEDLSLQDNQFSNAALEHLSDSTQLVSIVIGMGNNTVSDEGLVHLKKLTKLEWLGLQHSRVTDAGLRHLACLPKLRILWIAGSDVTKDGVERLRKTLPGLGANAD